MQVAACAGKVFCQCAMLALGGRAAFSAWRKAGKGKAIFGLLYESTGCKW
jgi:hypothetical protein